MANVVNEAVMLAIREYISKATEAGDGLGDVQTYQLDMRHLEAALEKAGSRERLDLGKYEEFATDRAYQ